LATRVPASAKSTTHNAVDLEGLLPLLACPACNSPESRLSAKADSLRCGHCDASFPIYKSGAAHLTWLYTDPEASRHEWQARYNGFLCSNSAEQSRLTRALDDSRVSSVGRERIANQLQARQTQARQIAELLVSLELDAGGFDRRPVPANALHSKLPAKQGLLSYYDNVFRDWAWNNGENEHLLGTVKRVLQSDHRQHLGKVLTLGAGACRLSYDLHREYSPELSVVLDINPLLLSLAGRVIHGDTVPLYEFPVAPLNHAAYAVARECAAPEELADRRNFHFLFADAMNPPLAAGSFDTLLTPWLIDIIPQNLSEFLPRLNHLLKKGGVWVNTGSLAFFHNDESWRYSEEEVLELIRQSGFEILAAERHVVPYLHSPHSAHGRMENLFSFAVKKVAEVQVPPRYEYLPEWILDTAQSVPESAESVVASSTHLLQAQVLAAINGHRTIEDIGALVATQYGFEIDESVQAVKRILIEVYEG